MTNNLLLDSHTLIWLLFEPERVSQKCRRAVESAAVVYASKASLWELTLKHNKGQLKYLPKDIADGYKKMGVEMLDITEVHILATARVKLNHKDPFDTLLVAQAAAEDLTLLTADKQLLDSPYSTVNAAYR